MTALGHDGDGGGRSGPVLERHLGLPSLVLAGVGSTIGSGIFVITGTAAARYAGPAITISFLLAGFVCLCAALCYGELAARYPRAGGAYSYALEVFGPFIAWCVGWCLVLEYLVASATVAVGWSSYFVDLLGNLGLHVPAVLAQAPVRTSAGGTIERSDALFNLPAALIVGFVTVLLVKGIRETNRANIAMVTIKVGIVLLVIAFGAAHVSLANLHPYVPANTGHFGEFGASGVARGAAIIFFAFLGFDCVSTSAEETRNPQRNIGLGILGALAVCTLLYVAMASVMTGLANYRLLDVANPVTVALAKANGALDWLASLVNVAVVIGLASAILMTNYGQTRILYSMAADGMVSRRFGDVDPTTRTPVFATVVVGTSCGLVAGVFPIEVLGELVSAGSLLAFMAVCACVPLLRRKDPPGHRIAFRAPLSPVVPFLGVASSLYLLASLPAGSQWRLAIWMGIGIALFPLTRRARMTAAAS